MTHRKRPTDARSLARFSLVVLALLAIIGIATWQYLLTPPKGISTVNLTIPPGSSVLKIGEILVANNLIRSPRVFQLYVRVNNLSLQAGDYSISRDSLPNIALSLTKGRENEIKVTIPEGYRREQIAEL